MKRADRKIFVLEASMLLNEVQSIYAFGEHDVVIPHCEIPRIQKYQKGTKEINYEAQDILEIIKFHNAQGDIKNWQPLQLVNLKNRNYVVEDLKKRNQQLGQFKMIYSYTSHDVNSLKSFDSRPHSAQLLESIVRLKKNENSNAEIILVTKDTELLTKAAWMGIKAQDFQADKVELDRIPSGVKRLYGDDSIINNLFTNKPVCIKDLFSANDTSFSDSDLNQYYLISPVDTTAENAFPIYINSEGDIEYLDTMKKNPYIFGNIKPRNNEQRIAHNAMMREKSIYSVMGCSGSGKTLITLASALELTSDTSSPYDRIRYTRKHVSLDNNELGFLPGSEQEKLRPFMGGFYDNIDFIQKTLAEKKSAKLDTLISEQIDILSLPTIRGRSLHNCIVIVDEAQNLTRNEMKGIAQRIGENCKMVFLGDNDQIDPPFLDRSNNGLSHLICQMQGQPLFSHTTFNDGERSEAANLVNKLL